MLAFTGFYEPKLGFWVEQISDFMNFWLNNIAAEISELKSIANT